VGVGVGAFVLLLLILAAILLLLRRRSGRKASDAVPVPAGAAMSQSQYANIVVREPEYDVGQVAVYSSARAFDDDDDNGANYAKGHLTMN
jgi:hypothetical protein